MKKRLLLKFVLTCVCNVLLAEAPAYTLKTKKLTDFITHKTGLISFCDTNGKKIVDEKPFAGCNFQPAVFDGKRYCHLPQTSQSTADAVGYGPGQHPGALINYRDQQQVSFFQNNTELVIPFLVSGKNYDVLWDNYSLPKRGDSRLSPPLFALQLFSKKGEAGWSAASRPNDQSRNNMASIKRAETGENMDCSWFEADVAGSFYPERRGSIP